MEIKPVMLFFQIYYGVKVEYDRGVWHELEISQSILIQMIEDE
jgi:hypothetical protein